MPKRNHKTAPSKPPTLPATAQQAYKVKAGFVEWNVNEEPPTLAFIQSAASILAQWDLQVAVERERNAVSAINSLRSRWYDAKARREKNATLPKEEQCDNPILLDGPDDPMTAIYETPEYFSYQSASKDLSYHMDLNYWLKEAVLRLLPETYKTLRVVRDLPRVYEHAQKEITADDWGTC